jgi:hypothetical protein
METLIECCFASKLIVLENDPMKTPISTTLTADFPARLRRASNIDANNLLDLKIVFDASRRLPISVGAASCAWPATKLSSM